MKKDITLGLACSLDFEALYFTLNAIKLYHQNFFQACEILLLDNNPHGFDTWPMKILANKLNEIVPTKYMCFLANTGQGYVKQKLIENTQTEWVLICDSHILFLPGSLDSLLEYLPKSQPNELITGVIYDETLNPIATHLKQEWDLERFGVKEMDKEKFDKGEPFEISLAELHVFACRKESWPGIPTEFKAAMHEEYYIYEKLKQSGGRGICLPQLGYIHKDLKFFPSSNSRIDITRNYLLTWKLLNKDDTEVQERLFKRLSKEVQDKILADLEGKSLEQEKECCRDKERPSERLTEYDEFKIKLTTHRLESINEILQSEENVVLGILQSVKKYLDQAKSLVCFSSRPIYLVANLFNLVPTEVPISIFSVISTIPELIKLREYALRDIVRTPIVQTINATESKDLAVLEIFTSDLPQILNILEELVQNKIKRIILLNILSSQQIIDQIAKFLLDHSEYSVIHVEEEKPGAYVLSNLPEDKPKLPSLIKMATNFIQAVAKHIVTGANMVDKETLEKRLLVCSICEHRNEDRCSVCGCFLISENEKMGKALWKDQNCPLGKWK